MAEKSTAKIFMHGRSQAVRLPKSFASRARKCACVASGAPCCWSRWNSMSLPGARRSRNTNTPFLPEGREQPPMPPPRKFFRRMICLDTNAVIPGSTTRRPASGRGCARHLKVSVRWRYPRSFCSSCGMAQSRAEGHSATQTRIEQFLTAPIQVRSLRRRRRWREAGEIRAALARIGKPIGPYDLFIAAQARRRGATLITANEREFARVPGLTTADWAAA